MNKCGTLTLAVLNWGLLTLLAQPVMADGPLTERPVLPDCGCRCAGVSQGFLTSGDLPEDPSCPFLGSHSGRRGDKYSH